MLPECPKLAITVGKNKRKRKLTEKSPVRDLKCRQKPVGRDEQRAAAVKKLGARDDDIAVGKRGEACLLSLVDGNLGLTLAVKLPRGIAQAARDTMTVLLGSLPPNTVKASRLTVGLSSHSIRMSLMLSAMSRFTLPPLTLHGNAAPMKIQMACSVNSCPKVPISLLFYRIPLTASFSC